MAPSCQRIRVSYPMSDSMSCIRRAKETGSEMSRVPDALCHNTSCTAFVRHPIEFRATIHGQLARSMLEIRQLPTDLRKIVLLTEFYICKTAVNANHMLNQGHGELMPLGEKGRWIADRSDQPLKTLGKFISLVTTKARSPSSEPQRLPTSSSRSNAPGRSSISYTLFNGDH